MLKIFPQDARRVKKKKIASSGSGSGNPKPTEVVSVNIEDVTTQATKVIQAQIDQLREENERSREEKEELINDFKDYKDKANEEIEGVNSSKDGWSQRRISTSKARKR